MDIVARERAIQAALASIMGPTSSGTLTVRSTGAAGVVPAGAFAVPFESGSLEEHCAVFVTRNPATQDGSWEVTSEGTPVAVQSMQGGAGLNFEPGAEFRWFPMVPAGIEEVSQAAGAFVGGERGTTLGTLLQIRCFKQLSNETWLNFYRAKLGDFPGAILCWESMAPTDGPVLNANNPRQSRVGANTVRYKHQWQLYLVSSRSDTEVERRSESAVLLKRVVEELFGKTGTRDGLLRISSDPGLQILSAGAHETTHTSYVDLVRFQTFESLTAKSAQDANPWLFTHIEARRPPETETQQTMTNPNIIVSMVDS